MFAYIATAKSSLVTILNPAVYLTFGSSGAKSGNPKVLKYLIYIVKIIGAPDRNRTCGPQIRNLMLYPTELRAR